MSSAMDHTNRKTTEILDGATKRMRRQTHLISRPKKVILVYTHSNVPIAEATTKPTPSSAHSGNTGSTESGNKRNTSRSVKTGSIQFDPWKETSNKHDSEQAQHHFSKCLQESSHHQHHPRDTLTLRHHSHTRTTMVDHTPSPK